MKRKHIVTAAFGSGVLSIALGLGLNALSVSSASASCNYVNGNPAANCGAAASDYFNKTVNNQSSSYQDVTKRVDTLKDVLKECGGCAMDTVKQGMDNITTNPDPQSSSDPQQ